MFRWGEQEEQQQSGPPPVRPGRRTERPTDEEALGAGLALNPSTAAGYDWDLRIGADGAYLSTYGIDEYNKDIAFMTARRAWDDRGQRITPDLSADLELDIETLLMLDARTQAVDSVTVSQSRHPDVLRIDAELTVADDRRHALVVPVSTQR